MKVFSLKVILLTLLFSMCAIAGAHAFSPAAQAKDYSKFSHASPAEHANLMDRNKCGSCHRPNGSLAPRFPIHSDCTGCHMVQFTAARSDAVNPICTICHEATQLHSSNAPLKSFSRLRSFNAQFDHAQHLQGVENARPTRGCASCHVPTRRGVAQTIPARLEAHRVCFECHAPGKAASESAACGSCHQPGRYSPTSTAARAYRVGFSHLDHSSRQRLNCQSCHTVRRRGLPQGRQVSSVMALEHLVMTRSQTCKTCHNGLRAFGDKDTHDCKRCHRREDFRMVG